jgi:hypothetical protein
VILAARSSGSSFNCRRLLIGINMLAAPFSIASDAVWPVDEHCTKTGDRRPLNGGDPKAVAIDLMRSKIGRRRSDPAALSEGFLLTVAAGDTRLPTRSGRPEVHRPPFFQIKTPASLRDRPGKSLPCWKGAMG